MTNQMFPPEVLLKNVSHIVSFLFIFIYLNGSSFVKMDYLEPFLKEKPEEEHTEWYGQRNY